MATDNETVAEIVKETRQECFNKQGQTFFGVNAIRKICDRIEAAHDREVAELQRRLKVAGGALDASLNYNNSEELRKAQRKAKNALAAIRNGKETV